LRIDLQAKENKVMKTANLIRWGALAAFASGVLWIVGGLLHLAYPQDPPGMLGYYLNYLGTAVFSGAYLGMLGGLVGLRARQTDSYGRLGRAGFFLASAGAALAFLGQASSGIFPQNVTLGWLFSDPGFGFMAGILLTSLGLLLMGVATLRAGVLPRWCGFGLIGLVVFLALGAYGGFVVVGFIWLALGYALGSTRSEVAGSSAYAG
jgi:hypothetical protein